MNNELFQRVDHRPWPMPARPWTMVQTWDDLLFIHWPVPVAVLRKQLPSSVELDTFDGEAWVGVVPFDLSRLRLRGMPSVPRIGGFLELNVRTYVVYDGKPGVWFLSLDAPNRAAIWCARAWYHLPYHRAEIQMVRDKRAVSFTASRSGGGSAGAKLRCTYEPTGEPARGCEPLAQWLTERYCLYATDRAGRLFRAQIHHVPWPLQPARVTIHENTMLVAQGLPQPNGPPLVHYSRHLEAVIWSPERLSNREVARGELSANRRCSEAVISSSCF